MHALQYHIESVHERKRMFRCELWDSSYTSTQNLKKHTLLKHEGKQPLKIKCEICFYDFTCKSSLKPHVKSVHENAKPFDCNYCNRSFSRKDHMKNHTALLHENEKPLKCKICSAEFPSKYLLNGHTKSHGNKPLKCDQPHCNFAYTYKSELRKHVKTRNIFQLFKIKKTSHSYQMINLSTK